MPKLKLALPPLPLKQLTFEADAEILTIQGKIIVHLDFLDPKKIHFLFTTPKLYVFFVIQNIFDIHNLNIPLAVEMSMFSNIQFSYHVEPSAFPYLYFKFACSGKALILGFSTFLSVSMTKASLEYRTETPLILGNLVISNSKNNALGPILVVFPVAGTKTLGDVSVSVCCSLFNGIVDLFFTPSGMSFNHIFNNELLDGTINAHLDGNSFPFVLVFSQNFVSNVVKSLILDLIMIFKPHRLKDATEIANTVSIKACGDLTIKSREFDFSVSFLGAVHTFKANLDDVKSNFKELVFDPYMKLPIQTRFQP